MLISTEKNFLFVHIPKTAGTSIRANLRPYCVRTRKFGPVKLLSKLGLAPNWRWDHFRIHTPLIVAEQRLPPELYDRLLKFAFVRNPWDRLVSQYHWRRRRKYRFNTRKLWAFGSFSNYLRWEVTSRQNRGRMLQLSMLQDSRGEIGVDRILRFESLVNDWTAMARELGVESALPQLIRTKHDDWRGHYTDEDAAFVAQHWAPDIEAFGYTFEDKQ